VAEKSDNKPKQKELKAGRRWNKEKKREGVSEERRR
jgi:hypothetical protein